MKKKVLIILIAAIFLVTGCKSEEKDKKEPVVENKDEVSKDNNGEENENTNMNENIGKNKVDFYLFYSDSCGHCHNERTWIDSIKDDYPYVEFHLYEVSEEYELFNKVRDAYKIEDEYVPVTIIGNDYFVGYSESKNRKFIRYIEELSSKENCGVVDVIINNGDVDSCMKINNK